MMKAAGVIRLLQTKQYQGFEVHPREFAETTMATAALDPAAGCVAPVVDPVQLPDPDFKVSARLGRRRQHLDGLALCAARYCPARRRRLCL